MADYYYFCAQLPTLQCGGAAPFTLAEFDSRVKALLPAKEAQRIIEDSRAGRLGGEYGEWEEVLRFVIAVQRNDAFVFALNSEYAIQLREQISAISSSALNPLDRQKRIDALCWQKLDDLSTNLQFSREAVICYRIKLSILEKYRMYRTDTGTDNFEEAVRLIDGNSAE